MLFYYRIHPMEHISFNFGIEGVSRSSLAQWGIRKLAGKMLELVKEIAPNVFKYAGAPCVRGKCAEGKMTCGKPKNKV